MGFLRLAILCFVVACGSGTDADGDGFDSDVDCDDGNKAIHPEADELCNGVDDNCDKEVDNDPVDGTTYFLDADNDSWGKETRLCTAPTVNTVERGGDCRDDIPTAFPGSTTIEVPKVGIDTDCDGNDFCTDLNCDGLPDIVVPSHHDGDYNITQSARLLSKAGGGWSLEPTPLNMFGTLGVALGDFDNDGYQDIVHASYNDGATVNTTSFVYWGKDHHAQATRTPLPSHGAHWACVADFDKNGFQDVLLVSNTDGVTNNVDSYIYLYRPGGFSAQDRIALPTAGATHCSVDDLDNDGFVDIVFANYATDGAYATMSYIYWGSDKADYPVSSRTALPTVGTRTSTIVDLDKDGKKDIIFWSHYNGTSHITDDNYIYWNKDGFSTANRASFSSMGAFRGAVVDLDNDGFNDIVAGGYYNNAWTNMAATYIYWGNAQNMYTAANRTAIQSRGTLEVIVDDINGDTYKDLLLTGQYDGDSYANSSIMWGTAGATYTDANRLDLPGYHVTNGAAVVDFNHDGFKDVFLPGYHNNTTGADATPWANQAYSRIYWGGASGLRATFYDQWPTRGAWDAVVAGK
jgi:hypothetical protein